MKKITYFFLLILVTGAVSCSKKDAAGPPLIAPEKITSSVMSWVSYQRKYIRLHDDFVAYDTTSKKMERGEFIRMVSEGKYFPVVLKSQDSLAHYKLYRLSVKLDKGFRSVIRDYGRTEYSHYQMEGKDLPGFDYVDIKGKVYNRETMKDKIVVVKGWFIACVTCVQEMPELNKMVNRYKDREDIVFVSLAFDTKEKLEAFLKKRQFDYGVVAEKEKYMVDDLKIKMYPTHLIIGRNGKVVSVMNSAEDMIPMVDELAKRPI